MFSTQLKAIEADAFAFNPRIEQIMIHANQISYVGKGAFDKLEKLSSLNFNSNPCHSGSAGKRSGVIELIAKIEEKCTDISKTCPAEDSKSSEELEMLTSELKIENLRLITKNEELLGQIEEFKKIQRQVDELKVIIQGLQASSSGTSNADDQEPCDDCELCENKFSSCTVNLFNAKETLKSHDDKITKLGEENKKLKQKIMAQDKIVFC